MKTSSQHTPFRYALTVFSCAVLTLILLAPVSHARITKCVDKSGKVVGYGSDCPSGTRSEQMDIRSTPAAVPATAGKSVAEQEAEFRKRQMEKQEAQSKSEKQAADKELRAHACDNARSYLKTLQSGTRILRTDPNTGERVVLGEEEHRKETISAQRNVDANCK
ncbi:MAG TPA: DUF4124 domain-containing protein [Burkholderiales bacterium]